MAETYGKLRTDLEIRSGLDSGVIVKDPVTRRFYRFTPVQGSVLDLLDGRTDRESIARIASERQEESRPSRSPARARRPRPTHSTAI